MSFARVLIFLDVDSTRLVGQLELCATGRAGIYRRSEHVPNMYYSRCRVVQSLARRSAVKLCAFSEFGGCLARAQKHEG